MRSDNANPDVFSHHLYPPMPGTPDPLEEEEIPEAIPAPDYPTAPYLHVSNNYRRTIPVPGESIEAQGTTVYMTSEIRHAASIVTSPEEQQSLEYRAPGADSDVNNPPSVVVPVLVMENTRSQQSSEPSVPTEVLQVGLYAKVVSRFPLLIMLAIAGLAFLLVWNVGIPGYFAFFEGNLARKSIEARTYDSFYVSVANRTDIVTDEDGDDKSGVSLGVKHDPFTEEAYSQSIWFYFKSKSGDVLTSENLESQRMVLVSAVEVVQEACLRTEDGSCKAAVSLMEDMGTGFDSAKVKQQLTEASAEDRERYLTFLGADADISAGTTSWIKARVQIGGPLPGFDNLTHAFDDQREVYEAMYKTNGTNGVPTSDGWIPSFEKILREHGNDDLDIYFAGGSNVVPRMFSDLMIDQLFAMLAFLFVSLFMWIQLGSVFLTICGMLQIIGSFILTLATWKLLGNNSFTFMHALVVYIILGIGADNTFVFADAWKQSRILPVAVGSLARRLQVSISRAANAMIVTSATTCAAFLFTAMTDLPVIATFGSFSAVVVGWNLLLVLTWFPAAVLVHERYFVQLFGGCCAARLCGCCCRVCVHQWGLERRPATEKVQAVGTLGMIQAVPVDESATSSQRCLGKREDKQDPDAKVQDQGKKEDLRIIERFFRNILFRFLEVRVVQVFVVIGFAALAITGVAMASSQVKLTTKSNTENFLKSGNYLQDTINIWLGTSDAFQSNDWDIKQYGSFCFGIDTADPIDRSGTDPLAQGEVLNMGKPNFNGEDLNNEAAQTAIVEACDRMGQLPSVAKHEESGEPETFCFMKDFKRYKEARSETFPVPSSTLVAELEAWRNDINCEGQGCYKNREETGVTQGRRDPSYYDDRTGYIAENGEMKFIFVSANLTLGYWEQHLDIITPEYTEWRDAADEVSKSLPITVMGLTNRLDWIAIMNALVKGVKTGVPASLGIAFIVLLLATANWRIASAATLSIMGVMASFFISFTASNWTLGMYECQFVQLTVGLAVDYVVHLAHAYNESTALTREDKMRDSLTKMGVSVFSGAVSTLGASMFLFICQFNVFYLYGSFIFFVILWSLVWALLFFPVLMMNVGPEGTSGDIKILRSLYDRIF